MEEIIQTVVDIINTLGFPVAVCVVLFIQGNKQAEAHRNEVELLRQSIENNTLAITKLEERLNN